MSSVEAVGERIGVRREGEEKERRRRRGSKGGMSVGRE